jgi:hypothetical protein
MGWLEKVSTCDFTLQCGGHPSQFEFPSQLSSGKGICAVYYCVIFSNKNNLIICDKIYTIITLRQPDILPTEKPRLSLRQHYPESGAIAEMYGERNSPRTRQYSARISY